MGKSVALLRGINVGGRRKLPMPALAAAFAAAGCTDVVTYIQSGNVVFRPPAGAASPADLVAMLEAAVADAAGFEVPVVVRTAADLAGVIAGQPFRDEDPAHFHVCFLGARPSGAALARFGEAAEPPEEFAQIETDVYLRLPNGMGRSKLGLAVDRLGVPVTVRNWRTVTRLAELAQ